MFWKLLLARRWNGLAHAFREKKESAIKFVARKEPEVAVDQSQGRAVQEISTLLEY